MSMYTTQQALEIAIKAVESSESLSVPVRREVTQKLKSISKQIWKKSWNRESILAAIHRFKDEHGRVPNTADLKLDELPSEATIRAHFHTTYSTLLSNEFSEYRFYKPNPKSNQYDMLTKDEWLCFFAEQFNKHLCPEMNSRVYNQLRDRGTPTWGTIARYTGDITWTGLMKSAGVKYLGSRGIETARILVVKEAVSPTVSKLDQINSERRILNEELKQILQNNPNQLADVI